MVASIVQLVLSGGDPWREHVEPICLDRFSCEAQGSRPDGTWTMLVGPACVPLADALAWAAEAADLADVSGPHVDDGQQRIRLPADPHAGVLRDLVGDVQWDALPIRAWRVAGTVSLGERDFIEAGRNLATPPAGFRVDLDDQDRTVSFDAVLKAPTLDLAGWIAGHTFRATMTGKHGLDDQMSDNLAVKWTQLSSADGRIDGMQ